MNKHLHTPDIAVIDPRSFQVRNLGFWRAPVQTDPQPRISRQVFDASGRLCAMTDARLDIPATQTIHALSGLPLFVQSADAGWRLSFPSEAGSVRESRGSRGSQSWTEYEGLLRPVAIVEQLSAESPRGRLEAKPAAMVSSALRRTIRSMGV